MNFKLAVAIFTIFFICLIAGCVDEPAQEPAETATAISAPSFASADSDDPKLALASYYNPKGFSITANASQYQLPLNLNELANINRINSNLRLGEDSEGKLASNGFVIIPWRGDDIIEPYKTMKEDGIPIFVTSDTLLHLYHIQFNEILKDIEEAEFFDALLDMTLAMQAKSKANYETFTDTELKESARRNVAYFSVALLLLQAPTAGYDEEEDKIAVEERNTENQRDKKTFVPIRQVEFTIPAYVKDEVDKEIANIANHGGFSPSCIFNSDPNRGCEDECCYCKDYSQYVPRGHYTRSEKLKRYFNAMMWYGRMAFLLKGGNVSECSGIETPLLTEADAKLATIQASLLSAELPAVKVSNTTAQELWTRMYSVTAFFVGAADDLTPYEYQKAIGTVFGSEFDTEELADDDKIEQLKAELANSPSPEIYGGSGVCVIYPPLTREKLQECLAKTKGLRVMGQRFIPDSYIFQQMVSPAVGMYTGTNCEDTFTCCFSGAGPARCFPRGLDVMAVLGSKRAETILSEEGDMDYAGKDTSYQEQLYSLQHEFDQFSVTDWNRNLYWSWLYTLKPLLNEFPAGTPTFMQTKAWQDKELQTALTSWTELRHDTILYAKQSYTPTFKGMPPQPKPVHGYVEPVPEFYSRLLALTEMTKNGLTEMDVLGSKHQDRLNDLASILDRLIELSKKELENQELTEADYEYIRTFGEYLDSVVAGVDADGKQTTMVADVHTDTNTKMVLEEGVGNVDLILVAYKQPDGQMVVGAGPVMSYYEFTHPMDDRLTDDKWRTMLNAGDVPEQPKWVKGIKSMN
ncbi:Protein of unknown function (DUF3160) [Methanophagales archaeon]|nr:Protein of unknown function (DUF3160) [Methanophagales archaeon]